MLRQALPIASLPLRRFPNVPAFEGSSRRAFPRFASDFVGAGMESPRGGRGGNEAGLDVMRVAVADSVADLVFVDAARSVGGFEELRTMTRASTSSAVAFVEAGSAIRSAVADEGFRDAPILRLAEELPATPKMLESLVDGIFVDSFETVGNSKVAAFMLVRFVLAISFAVASGMGMRSMMM